MYEKIIKKIMELMAERLVVRRSELLEHVRRDIKGNPHDPKQVVDAITKMLVQQGSITPIYASETTFAITQKGMKGVK